MCHQVLSMVDSKYSAVLFKYDEFHKNTHNTYPVAHLWGCGMCCLTEKLAMFSFKFCWLSNDYMKLYGPVMSSKISIEIPQNFATIAVLGML